MGGGGSTQLGGYGGTGSNYNTGGMFTGGAPILNQTAQQSPPIGSAGWVGTHPDYQGAPAQGVGSLDWIKTHPNFGMQQPNQGAQNMFTGGAQLQGGGNDIGALIAHMLQGYGGGGGYMP